MCWSVGKSGALILHITRDEVEGELSVVAAFDGGTEQDIVYEGMFYSQLDESSEGVVITHVSEITPAQLKLPEHREATALLYSECGEDDAFLRDMHWRGNHLYVHCTADGKEYIVLAKRLAFGESRPTGVGNI